MHKSKDNQRHDFLHQVSTKLVKNHDLLVIEDLKLKNMSRSARGTVDNPGTKVKAKTGLNRSILNEAWHKFSRILNINSSLRAIFKCVKCGCEAHADVNAAQNILKRAGRARMACQANLNRGRQQEPAEANNSSSTIVV